MDDVDLTQQKPTRGDVDVPAVLRSVSQTFENNERFNKLTHGGAKIVTAVLEVVSDVFETHMTQDDGQQFRIDELRKFMGRRKSLK